jgi:hypothetical protein
MIFLPFGIVSAFAAISSAVPMLIAPLTCSSWYETPGRVSMKIAFPASKSALASASVMRETSGYGIAGSAGCGVLAAALAGVVFALATGCSVSAHPAAIRRRPVPGSRESFALIPPVSIISRQMLRVLRRRVRRPLPYRIS